MSSVQVRVLALFSIGYFVSYVFRGVNLGFAPFVTHELGLSAADLGLLTSLYFLGFAGAQIPAGVMLDHFGARRVTAGMLLFAAAGAAVFGAAHGIGTMMVGRLLIGVGVSVCLGAAFKALAQHFPVGRLPLVNGLVMAVGGLGGVVVGSPLTWLLGWTNWRAICFGLAVLTVVVAASIGFGAPEAKQVRHQGGLVSQFKGTWHILSSRAFWKISSFSVVTQGVFYAMQSLWVGPYLRDVAGFDAPHAARLVSVLGFAMMAGCVGFGAAARVLERRGVSVYAFCGVGMALFVATQVAIVARMPLPPAVLWACIRDVRRRRHPDLRGDGRALSRPPDRPREHDAHAGDLPADLCVPDRCRRGTVALARGRRPLSGRRAPHRMGRSACAAARERDLVRVARARRWPSAPIRRYAGGWGGCGNGAAARRACAVPRCRWRRAHDRTAISIEDRAIFGL